MEDEAVALQRDCSAMREDELVALEAIFPKDQLRVSSGRGEKQQTEVTFSMPVQLPKELEVYVPFKHSNEGTVGLPLRLLHLPSLALTVSLPSLYPLREPPQIVRLTAPWLSDLARVWVSKRLLELWQEVQGEVLWSYGEWAREGWIEESLHPRSDSPFSDPQHERRLFLGPHGDSQAANQHLRDSLAAFDRACRQSVFGKERFLCSICLEAKKGDFCRKIRACGHVFCQECLLDYLTLHLTEGSLKLALSCPDVSCVASTAKAIPEGRSSGTFIATGLGSAGTISVAELNDFLQDAPALINRLRFLKEKEVAESDPTAVPCPRMDCQTLTPKDGNETSARWEAFRQCKACNYSFCIWCRKTWHAPTPCSLPSTSSLLDKYAVASPEVRRALEMRYGRKNLLRLKALYEEEKANQEWLKGKTQICPHCSSRVEKSSGCNHMTCQHCSQHFCYLCGIRINPSHPYAHFNQLGSQCYNRLFDGILGPPPGIGEQEGEHGGEGALMTEERRREEEQHLIALAAIQAAYGED